MFSKQIVKVKLGNLQTRNNWSRNRIYDNTEKGLPIIDKEEAGIGYKHLLRKQDIFKFIELLPDWNELAIGLNLVMLARGRAEIDGWYRNGKIAICAWERDLWQTYKLDYFNEHKRMFDKLDLEYEKRRNGIIVKFTDKKARAYQLLHVFLHELGHHHDLMTTKRKVSICRGESYAEEYANKYSEIIWCRYFQIFK